MAMIRVSGAGVEKDYVRLWIVVRPSVLLRCCIALDGNRLRIAVLILCVDLVGAGMVHGVLYVN